MAAKCVICAKSVYAMDPQINLDGNIMHKACAKCTDCKCQITMSNFVKNGGGGKEFILLCKTHYLKRFHEQGSYIGAEKYKVKPARDVQASEKASEKAKQCIPAEGTASTESPIKKDKNIEEIKTPPAKEDVTTSAASAAPPEDEKPAPGTIREIQRRLSMRNEPTSAVSSPKSLAELVPNLEEWKATNE